METKAAQALYRRLSGGDIGADQTGWIERAAEDLKECALGAVGAVFDADQAPGRQPRGRGQRTQIVQCRTCRIVGAGPRSHDREPAMSRIDKGCGKLAGGRRCAGGSSGFLRIEEPSMSLL